MLIDCSQFMDKLYVVDLHQRIMISVTAVPESNLSCQPSLQSIDLKCDTCSIVTVTERVAS